MMGLGAYKRRCNKKVTKPIISYYYHCHAFVIDFIDVLKYTSNELSNDTKFIFEFYLDVNFAIL